MEKEAYNEGNVATFSQISTIFLQNLFEHRILSLFWESCKLLVLFYYYLVFQKPTMTSTNVEIFEVFYCYFPIFLGNYCRPSSNIEKNWTILHEFESMDGSTYCTKEFLNTICTFQKKFKVQLLSPSFASFKTNPF